MKRRRSGGWYESGPKQPPPERGIRMKKAGTTWWGQRWIQALEVVLQGDSGRLARGKTYARAGRTHDLVVNGGLVSAKVTGSRTTPYEVTIALSHLDEAMWKKAVEGMALKAQFSAELLAGQMPQQIDDVFREAGASLFPKQRTDLVTSCSCPDWGDPCKHVAATHYVLGEALDRDPFLLFELRGKTKNQVLDALRNARGAPMRQTRKRGRKAKASPERQEDEVPTVKLGKIQPLDYDRPRQALPKLRFAFDEPGAHGALLRQLGTPATWENDASPADILAPLVHAAAETARRLALTEPSGADEPPPASPHPASGKRAPKRRSAR